MTTDPIVAALASLPGDMQLTVLVRVDDFRRALQQQAGGPEVLDTKQAAQLLGYRPERWRRWAEAGRIEGAWQDGARGPWRLPRTACEAHLRGLSRRGAVRVSRGDLTLPRSVPRARGPWKAQGNAKS
jgi:hypothetical protein